MLAAGRSRRLGRPKQSLPFGDRTLLEATVTGARQAPLDDLVVVLGPEMEPMARRLAAMGVRSVETPPTAPACSLSIRTGLAALSGAGPEAVLLLLGDQPGVGAPEIRAVVEGWRASGKPLAVGRYRGEWAHPFLLSGPYMQGLQSLEGEKGVWRILEANADQVEPVEFDRPVPRDVDLWEDYLALLAEFGLPEPGI